MGGGRQAWCPRCDEVRAARPGSSCPVCGRQLLAVPPARPGQPRPGRGERVARRLRALAPAAAAVGVACLVLLVVASAFAAGRLTRTTPSAPAAATATTGPGFLDEEPETGRRDFGWEDRASELTVELRSLTVGTGFSRLELHVDGVRRGREISALEGLRIRDADGRDLLLGGQVARIATAASRPAPGGGIDTEVVLDRPLDVQDVAVVELRGLTVARGVRERIGGTLVDRELARQAADNRDDTPWLAIRRGCPGCQLQVACEDCTSVRVTGWAYRRGRVLIAVEALDEVEQTALNPSRRRVLVTDGGGLSELPAWIDGSGGSAVISVAADLLAAARYGDPDDDDPMAFSVVIQAQAEEVVRGSWTITSAVR
jgi:Heavy metal binding domain